MKPENAIEVQNITKKFKIYYDKSHSLKEKILFSKRNKYEEKNVLNGVTFEVKKGEAIGLVGHNGCGKSTILKLLTQIMYPDSGTIEMSGRVSSLLELGAGFHPDMTGRENIYINASIFGLKRKEIDKKLAEIIDFSELGGFIDNPVRTYSSGMYMRLAFSVAINVNADILLIDEILAVGDANFQVKCFNKLMEIKKGGTTIVIVSHSLGQIEQICERSLWIHEGIVKEEGTPRKVHRDYLNYMGSLRNHQTEESMNEQEKQQWNVVQLENHSGSGEVRITNIQLIDENNVKRKVFKTYDDLEFIFEYEVYRSLEATNIGISISRNDGLCCYGISTWEDDMGFLSLKSKGEFRLRFPQIHLLPGHYCVSIGIEDNKKNSIDFMDRACEFDIYSDKNEVGAFYLEHQWKI